MALTKHEKYTIKQVKRSDIKLAEYNPRYIDKHAKSKLKKNLNKTGLVMPLVWNERTGNLVAGHQRISILDEMEGDGNDYEITVSAIDVDIAEEKKLNVFLNNVSAQGYFDSDLLLEILSDSDVGFDGGLEMGFDALELKSILPEDLIPQQDVDIVADVKKIEKLKKQRKEYASKVKEEDDAEFFAVVVFQNRAEADKFLKHVNGHDRDRYVDGQRMFTMLGIAED